MQTERPLSVAVENFHDFVFLLIESLQKDFFHFGIWVICVSRQTGVEVKLVQELQFLIRASVVFLLFDHLLQLLFNLNSYSHPPFIDLLLFDLVFGHFRCLDQRVCILVSHFARVTFQGLENIPKVLAFHQILLHHVQQGQRYSEYDFWTLQEEKVPDSIRHRLWEIITEEADKPLECEQTRIETCIF